MTNPIIQLKNVSKKFKNHTLFENTDFALTKGEVVAILGENGSGKSIFFKMISGLEAPTEGEIYVNGELLVKNHNFPNNVGIMINSPSFIEMYPGKKNLQLLASIQNLITDKKIEETMNLVGLEPDSKVKVKNYSTGMKQKLALAQAVMENQEILLLDEPFNGVDENSRDKIKEILLSLKAEGKTILLTSHYAEEINFLVDKKYRIQNNTLKTV